MEKLIVKKLLDKLPHAVGHIYTLFVIIISFVLFNGNGLSECIDNLKGMFGLLNVPFSSAETNYYLKSYAFVFLIAIFGATPVATKFIRKIKAYDEKEENIKAVRILNILEPVTHIILLLLVTGYLLDGSFNPFLYFRF